MPTCHTLRALENIWNIRNISNTAANHSSFNCVTKNLGETLRGLKWLNCTRLNQISSNFVTDLVRETIILFFPKMTDIHSTVWGQEIVILRFTDFSQRWKLSKRSQSLKFACIFLCNFACIFFIRVFGACICMKYGRFRHKKHVCNAVIPAGLSRVAGCWQKSLPTWLVSAGYSAWNFVTDGIF